MNGIVKDKNNWHREKAWMFQKKKGNRYRQNGLISAELVQIYGQKGMAQKQWLRTNYAACGQRKR